MTKKLVISLCCIVILSICPSFGWHWYEPAEKDTPEVSERHHHDMTLSRLPRDAPDADSRDRSGHSPRRQRRPKQQWRTTPSTPPSAQPGPYLTGDINVISPNGNHGNTSSDTNITELRCSSCEMRQQRRQLRIAMIQKDILRKLKLSAPPTINSSRPDITLLPDNIFNPPTPESQGPATDPDGNFQNLIFGEPPPMLDYIKERGSSDLIESNLIYFGLGDDVVSSTMNKAHLSVYIKKKEESSDATTMLRIYKLINDSNGNIVKSRNPEIRERIFLNEAGTGRWYSYRFKSIAEDWKRRPSENIGLYIFCNDWEGNNLVLMHAEDATEDKSRKPLLTVLMTERTRRSKRSYERNIFNCEEGSKETRCCRFPLVVDFDEFGWDFIIQPRRYRAFYCAGECPFSHMTGSAHSHMQILQQSDNAIGGPCCTPSMFSDISILHFDDKGIIHYRPVQEMVVDSCSCN